ncbi:MAG: transporter substrate-binding domain-containing protein, partial [Hungatella sp.]
MTMRKNVAKIKIAVLLVLISFAICGIASVAMAEDNQVIRVAYPIQDGMTEFDEYGNHSGYIYEYLEEIAQYTGWDYEFVTPPGDLDQSLSDALSMVERGEIDLLGGLLYSRELDQQFDYSEYNSGQVETVLQVLYDDPYNIVIDSQVDQKLKVAVRNSTGRMAKELQEYCKLNLVTPEFILCKTAEEQVQAMRDGRAEAMLNNSLNRVEGVRTLAGFASKPFYFVTGEGKNADLMADLNAATLSIRQSDPYFALTLEEKYFAPKMERFLLSEREKEYIKNNQEIQVGVLENQPPFQYRDHENQSIHGISIDLLNYIAHGTGLQLHLKMASNPEQLYVMAKNKEIDLVAGMPYHYNLAREHNLTLSRSYISSQTVMMVNENTKRKQTDDRILAITPSDRQPVTDSAKTMEFSTWAECIKAVDAGVADYVYVDTYTAQYYVNIPQYSDLKLVPQTSKPYKICFGLSKPSDAVLLGILNKAVMAIPDSEMQTMTYQNILRETPLTFAEFAQKNILQTMLVTVGIFAVIIAMLAYILRQRVKSNRQISLELKKHLQVYAIAGEYFFEYNYQTGKLMFSEPEGEKGDLSGNLNFDYSKYPDDPMTPQRQERFLEIIRSESERSYEVQLSCADGEEHWVRITIETIRTDEGDLV